MKRMLFNATQQEELRVAIVDGQRLIDLDIESTRKEQRKSNIYKGVVIRVEPSLEAAFVDYGVDRHGFLPFKEISRQYLRSESGEQQRGRVSEILREGTELMVQVDKDERGNKGAALTTYISLAGRYLVLMPNNPRGGGVSRRVEGEDRAELREVMNALEVPDGMSIIARTAGIGRSTEELQWDLNYLKRLWEAIENASGDLKAPQLLYRESNLVIRAIRDLYHPEIGEILIDSPAIHKDAMDFVRLVIPGSAPKVKLYQDEVPLFSRFQIEHQIETAYRREVPLPSGGAIVIDKTEALGAIDVNSARATKGADIEQTALNTNLEAADEIARQLRLRDLGGLIVVDFIDMENPRNQREVENRFRDALKYDRARVQTGKISRFGMMELSRQRLQGSIAETSHSTCPRCSGTGQIRDVPSSSLHILRLIGEEAMKDNTAMVRAQVPVAVATYLLNEKRGELAAMEARLKVSIILIPSTTLETPNFQVERLRPDELGRDDVALPSYEMAETLQVEEVEAPSLPTAEPKAPQQQPVVRGITPDQPAPAPTAAPARSVIEETKPSLFTRILGWFKAPVPATQPVPQVRSARDEQREPRRERERDERHRRGGRPDRGEGRGGERNEQRRRDQRAERGDNRSAERGDNRGERGEHRTAERGDARVNEARAERQEQRRDTRQRSERSERGEQPDQLQGTHRAQQPSEQRRQPQQPQQQQQQQRGDRDANGQGNGEAGEARRGRNRRGGRRHERGDAGQPHAEQPAQRAASDRARNEPQRDVSAAPANEPAAEPASAAASAHAEALFVPPGERIIADAVSLPQFLDRGAAADVEPREAAVASTISAPGKPERAPELPVQLGELELVGTRQEYSGQTPSGTDSVAPHAHHRAPRRRHPRSGDAVQSELVLVETLAAPAPIASSAATQEERRLRRSRPSREHANEAPKQLVQVETHADGGGASAPESAEV